MSADDKKKSKTESDAVHRLMPESGRIELVSGMEVEIVPLKTRQFFRLLKVITRGGASMLTQMPLRAGMAPEEFTQNLLALLVFSIPEAEQEAIDFFSSMVTPVGLTGDKDADREKRVEMLTELNNPELDDLLTIAEAIVQREGKDIQALGNRLARMFSIAEKAGQTKPDPQTKEATPEENAA